MAEGENVTRWKWDTDQAHPLAKYRIPATAKVPLYPYLASFCRESAKQPTVHETKMLVSFIDEMKERLFDGKERALMATMPFDTAVGCNTVVFCKYAERDWGYRRRGWQTGSVFTPPSPQVPTRRLGPMHLPEVMDLVHREGNSVTPEYWVRWKAAHPEVFE